MATCTLRRTIQRKRTDRMLAQCVLENIYEPESSRRTICEGIRAALQFLKGDWRK